MSVGLLGAFLHHKPRHQAVAAVRLWVTVSNPLPEDGHQAIQDGRFGLFASPRGQAVPETAVGPGGPVVGHLKVGKLLSAAPGPCSNKRRLKCATCVTPSYDSISPR